MNSQLDVPEDRDHPTEVQKSYAGSVSSLLSGIPSSETSADPLSAATAAEMGEWIATRKPGVYTDAYGETIVKPDDLLTAGDTDLVAALTDEQAGAEPLEITLFKTAIASDRLDGSLSGEVTPPYISTLIEKAEEAAKLIPDVAELYASGGDMVAAPATHEPYPDALSLDLLNAALAVVEQKSDAVTEDKGASIPEKIPAESALCASGKGRTESMGTSRIPAV